MDTQPWGQTPTPPAQPPQWGEPGYDYRAHGFTPPSQSGQQPPRRPKRGKGKKLLLAAIGVVVGLGFIGALAGEDPAAPTAQPAPSAAASTAAPATTAAPVTTAKPKPVKATTPPTTAKPKPIIYRQISARQWALIAKNPDAHDSEHVIVHGQVTQFDAATGDDTFRADVDGVVHRPSYGYVDYPTNTILYGDAGKLTNLVEGDLFTARVRVAGAYSYDTQIGGNTTVPMLQITTIRVTGHLD